MHIVKPEVKLLYATPLDLILHAARHSYQSHEKANEQSDAQLLRHLLKNDESPIEHSFAMFDVTCSYAIHIHIARHRFVSAPPPSVCFLSQRYTSSLGFVLPVGIPEDSPAGVAMIEQAEQAEAEYLKLRDAGIKKQDARRIIPQGAAVKGSVSSNLRSWLTVVDRRTAKKAEPEVQLIVGMMRDELRKVWGDAFDPA